MNSARWQVPADHPALAGHFPGRPILPGAVLLDRLLALVGEPVGGIASAKFLSPALPGDILEFSWQRQPAGGIVFSIRAGERTVASGRLDAATP